MKLLVLVSAVLVFVGVIFWLAASLGRKSRSDLRAIWYLLSLSVVVTFIFASWAIQNGALDERGSYVGNAGSVFKRFIDFSMDVTLEAQMLAVMVGVTVLPQFFSYVLSGLSGYASSPVFVGKIFCIAFWSLIKSFLVCAGCLFSIGIFSAYKGWIFQKAGGFLVPVFFSETIICFSFYGVCVYREAQIFPEEFKKMFPKLRSILVSIHQWFTRNELVDLGGT